VFQFQPSIKIHFLGKISYKFFTGTFSGLARLETQEEENALFELVCLLIFFQQVNCQDVK